MKPVKEVSMPYAELDSAEERDGFRFRGGNLALDLTATLKGRLKPCPVDLLRNAVDLSRWFKAAGLCSETPPASEEDLELARELREAIYGLATGRTSGTGGSSAHLATLNRIAAAPAATPQLTAAGSLRLVGSSAALLTLVAREAVTLLGGEEAERLRQCEAQACTLLFVDRSRKRDRRWCSMSGCGNKAKVDSFRRRQREALQGR
jgi:predicted RNA-binding Zn ribbon-like protein